MALTGSVPATAERAAPARDASLIMRAIQEQNAGNVVEAERLLRICLAADPNDAVTLYSLGVILVRRGDAEPALSLLDRAIQVAPTFAPMWGLHGAALQAAGRNDEALQSYDRAIELKPDFTEVLLNSGVLLRKMMRHHEALERFNKVLTIKPDHEGALGNCGIILTEFKQSREAIAMFERLLQVNPNYDYGLGLLCYERLHICDWTGFDTVSAQMVAGLRAGQRTCKSLPLMAVTDDCRDHQISAELFASQHFPPAKVSLCNGERYRHKKIRLAYMSADLREHPVGHLMAGIFEHHDKSRFETTAISLGIDDRSRLRGRMLAAFDHFIDVKTMSSRRIAELIREREIDIVVDLGGYTSDSRSEVLALRPAPIQVNYLGYPGTMGVRYMDYIIADRHVIPPEHQPYYNERVVYMPDAYLPTDGSITVAERTPTREECKLPPTGFVFCSFNHDYKISPGIFDVWMRLLVQVPDSVLWLMSRNAISQANLRQAAAARGVAPERLVFAERVPMVEDHLARYRLADLFLDTHPYNAHTTAADALLAGLPVLTCMGKAFPARVAGSLLHAIGLPQMITHSLDGYEALAVRYAQDQALRESIRAQLATNRQTHPLFDTESFCRNLEASYIAMWRRQQVGDARDALGG